MYLFSFPLYRALSAEIEKLCRIEVKSFDISRFSNGELWVHLPHEVKSRHCIVLGSVAPPEEQMVSLLILADTLKREGAASVTALLPYLAYSRQDKVESGKSRAICWLGKALAGSGVDRVVTIDLHNTDIIEEFPLSIISLSPAPLWADVIRRDNLLDATLVAPDKGARSRARAVHEAAGLTSELTLFLKHRDNLGVVSSPMGKAGTTNIIIDDILDTGATLIQACEALVKGGATRNIIMVSHGIFTGLKWNRLWELSVEKIYTTDTVGTAVHWSNSRPIEVVSIAPLLARHISEMIRDFKERR